MSRTIQPWKVRRELQRLTQQLRALPEFFYEPPLRWWHDRTRAHRLKISDGQIGSRDKVAVYLVYQPAGLVASSLDTCNHLTDNGYAPLVVSNAPLSDRDRQRLQSVCWRVVERANFGYDFGGYRDGIWLLDQWGLKPQTLILMNDSVWFPVIEGDQTVRRMEAMSGGFRGILKLGTGQGAIWRRGREPFLGSFFLMFDADALASSAFVSFWTDYRNTSNKYKTIRRGERRLSYVMRDAGFEGISIFDPTQFEHWLDRASPSSLRQLLDELVTLDTGLQMSLAEAAFTYDSSSTDHEQDPLALRLREVIRAATVKSNLFSSAPICMLRDFQLPFVKKAMDPWNTRALRRIRSYVHEPSTSLPFKPTFAEELDQRLGKAASA